MSNPAVYLLDEGKVKNKTVRIEDNLGEAIHIHIDDIRLSLTINEFLDLCQAIKAAAEELFRLEGLDWNMVDNSSLDWSWLSNYENIETFCVKEVFLDDLYTVRHLTKNGDIKKIVKLKDSLFVEELSSLASGKIDHYYEKNLFEESSAQRLTQIYQLIKEKGYPYNNKYIMVDENNRIFDGDHRAAVLYVLFGGKHKIPVLEIKGYGNEETISEICKNNSKQVVRYRIKKVLKKCYRIAKKPICNLCKVREHKQQMCNSNFVLSSRELFDFLKHNDISYFIIDNPVVNDGKTIKRTLVVDRFNAVVEKYKNYSTEIYKDYSFLYSTPKPLLLETTEGNLLIWDRLCCKSRFEKAILPLDKVINSYVLGENRDEDYLTLKRNIIAIYIISNAVLEKCLFDLSDVEYIEGNKEILRDSIFEKLLAMVFFKYTNRIIGYLQVGDYSKCVEEYVKFIGY